MVNSVVQGLMTRSSWQKSLPRCSISSTWKSYSPQSIQSSTSPSEITAIESSPTSAATLSSQTWSKLGSSIRLRQKHVLVFKLLFLLGFSESGLVKFFFCVLGSIWPASLQNRSVFSRCPCQGSSLLPLEMEKMQGLLRSWMPKAPESSRRSY